MFFLGENLFKEKVFPEPLSKTFSNKKHIDSLCLFYQTH